MAIPVAMTDSPAATKQRRHRPHGRQGRARTRSDSQMGIPSRDIEGLRTNVLLGGAPSIAGLCDAAACDSGLGLALTPGVGPERGNVGPLGARLPGQGIFFGIITRQAIRRGTFTSVKELINAIEVFIDGWNDRCEPFVWTKTADEILAKAKPRQKTSNTRH